ncbi:TonB-dependent receptor plug domain-containing protein [Solirubrum puertoriconensis]|uniref:TonB-dependent receptor plug domain-containing protein n=1 Tax=Solirubrum puertoriconensis TaxID=1751427 RepID=A0A9X0L4T2_SOLP1|nr:TonB-dependent receptor plug domain-containing protein [Solirubrum puertoriconensis]KUG07983.1 hypothetical protein ASU33_07180 [Solirubrum puertoriconensis]
MPRLLPACALFLCAATAQAQQPDSLLTRRSSVIFLATDSATATPAFTTIQPLLSRVAGVQVTPYSGAPGANAVVRIRGAASLGDNAQPLYVVDGVPVFQYQFSGYTSSQSRFTPAEAAQAGNNPLLALPLGDVESVEVLKGAFETAQYGAQGQNGVVRITTRRGSANQPLRVSYTGYGGMQQVRRRYDLLDAREFAELANEAAAKANEPAAYSATQLNTLGPGTDWQGALLRTAPLHEHHLGLSGGTAHGTRYFTGLDYLSQGGVLLNSFLQRYSLRTNLAQDLGRWHLDGGVSASLTNQHQLAYNALQNTLLALPTLPLRNPDGQYAGEYNSIAMAERSNRTPRQQRLLVRLGARYELSTNLQLEVRGSLERDYLRQKTYDTYERHPLGLAQRQVSRYRQWVLNPALRYSRQFAGRHAVAADLELMHQSNTTADSVTTYLLVDPRTATGGIASSSGFFSIGQTFMSARLRGSYSYASRYELQASIQRTASSRGLPTKRWQWLPSAQVTWHAAQEGFLANQNAVSYLDAWVGWGSTSNAGDFGSSNFILLPVPGQAAYPFLLTELTRHTDAGLHLGLCQNQVTTTLSAYQRNTSIAIGTQSADQYIRNQGVEVSVAARWHLGQVKARSTVAASVNQNHFEANSPLTLGFRYHEFSAGQTLSNFQGWQYLGADPATGAPRYLDRNNDGRFQPDDRQALGSGLPRQLLSLQQEVSIKRIKVQAQLDGMFGYQVLNTTAMYLDMPNGEANASGRVRNRWRSSAPNASIPGADASLYNMPLSTYALQSGNHLRLTSLVFRCKIWSTAAREASVWAGGHNLLVLARYRGYDPNVSSAGSDSKQAGLDAGAYPVPRTIVLGVQATL